MYEKFFFTTYTTNKMANSFNTKLAELEKEKSELDISFLQSKKQDYEKRISELLVHPINEWEEETAIAKFNEVREYYTKIWEINYKIDHIPETIEEIDKKISLYKERREKVKNIPLYKNTEKWIIEILWWDPLYQYAKESGKENLTKKLEERSLKPNEYSTHIENMYKELFKDNKKVKKENNEVTVKKIEHSLPEWMSEQINEELKNSKNIKPQDIEKFLKNELKKNAWEIMVSHIKNKFKENHNQAYEYIRRLIINYPWFKIIENINDKNPVTQAKSKNDKLISSISQEEIEDHKNERIRKNKLIVKLNEIWKIEDLKTRISKYFDLFEELNNSFYDRNEFESYVIEIITHTHRWIEKEIVKTLNWLIQWNTHMEKTLVYKYNVYKFNRGNRRMIAYPNWEIFTLCPHEEYERIINTQPPADKTE